MYYNILFSTDNKLIGFKTDMENMPVPYETEEKAEEAKKGHIAEAYIETIEIEY